MNLDQIKTKRLLLTHLGPEMTAAHRDPKNNLRAELLRDDMEIEL